MTPSLLIRNLKHSVLPHSIHLKRLLMLLTRLNKNA